MRTGFRSDSGSVTVEAAFAIASLAVVLVLCAGGLSAVGMQVRCVDSSREAADQVSAKCTLIEIDGAQHGFAVHDDPAYLEPQTLEWQALVIRETVAWITGH